jgi:hypothetical protein
MNNLEIDVGEQESYSKVWPSGESIVGYNCLLGSLDCVLQYKLVDTSEM